MSWSVSLSSSCMGSNGSCMAGCGSGGMSVDEDAGVVCACDL